ncbi:hypothetical protein H4R20_005034 [Coemansia guatemalensis]|uniref:Xylanolytic transcriptional activator regulatory domain-containing protein n=1 Tax=Coemansia guatemalensis TaxID=2761395 RepID=A0A9W8HWF3_9FUNG|nr:hypothetical protein H4R20_005034 [Coemansia guatemalensis]
MTADSSERQSKSRGGATGHRSKRRASSLHLSENHQYSQHSDTASTAENQGSSLSPATGSVSDLLLKRLRDSKALELPQMGDVLGSGSTGDSGIDAQSQTSRSPIMEMLRLQTQISSLVDQLRNLTIRVSGMSPPTTASVASVDAAALHDQSFEGEHNKQGFLENRSSDNVPTRSPKQTQNHGLGLSHATSGKNSPHEAAARDGDDGKSENVNSASDDRPTGSIQLPKPEHPRGLNVSRDLINHLISVYFEYCHSTETGMYPIELYKDRLCRAQVSEPFLLSTLAVASRFSEDPRVAREPAYLAGYDFFERVTRGLMMDVLERDCVENMLTLNNLAVYAVGLPVANRGWYFSGLAMRMATQMSLQKVDAPGRMPGASMMSGPGIESARRAFWTTLLLEALASFASGEPPPITNQDIHVAEPFDDPSILSEDPAAPDMPDDMPTEQTESSGRDGDRARGRTGSNSSNTRTSTQPGSKCIQPNACAYIAQLSMLLIRVARLNGNRHPESAQFSPEYATLHTEMVTWYHGLPDIMQIKPSTAKDEIAADPRLFGAKMFVHCHYHASIIALHQPRADLVRVDSTGGSGGNADGSSNCANSGHQSTADSTPDQQWRQIAQQQCLTAACTMTELLAIARTLDVRYHIVTFGFAVFMAGVVHVGAVACTPRDSNERQYSINCVKEHIRCLDRLGKYFAFHYIMAKHIRAQLHAIEVTDARRQNAAAAAAASASTMPSSQQQQQQRQFSLDAVAATVAGTPFDLSAALGISQGQSQQDSLRSASSTQMGNMTVPGISGLDTGLMSVGAGSPSSVGDARQSEAWLGAMAAGFGGGNSAANAMSYMDQSSSSMDMLLGMLATPSSRLSANAGSGNSDGNSTTAPAQCPGAAVCAGLCGAHSPPTAASMIAGLQGLSGMAGLGSGIGSLVELFSSNSDGAASLYPQKIISNSSLAPLPRSSNSNTATQETEPQQFGSLPPHTPL